MEVKQFQRNQVLKPQCSTTTTSKILVLKPWLSTINVKYEKLRLWDRRSFWGRSKDRESTACPLFLKIKLIKWSLTDHYHGHHLPAQYPSRQQEDRSDGPSGTSSTCRHSPGQTKNVDFIKKKYTYELLGFKNCIDENFMFLWSYIHVDVTRIWVLLWF